jgi:hypothetical protein
MKKIGILFVALTVSSWAFAGTDHYLRRDGGSVQHLKITHRGDDIRVTLDVDAEAEGNKSCSSEIQDDAKKTAENELVVKKQAEGEATYCTVKIHLSGDEARLEQSDGCEYFLGNLCKFDTKGQPLVRIK